jgi:hypothetical protein
MPIETVDYTYNTQILRASGSVESRCNGITFVNIGSDIVTVLGFPMQPGQWFEPPNQIAGGRDMTNYDASFAQGAGTQPALLIIRQFYADANR